MIDPKAAIGQVVADPERTAVLCDFDGTLSAIVRDPTAARPIDGALEVLATLSERLRLVALVSGRPISFLQERTEALAGLRYVGLHGLEWDDGRVDPDVEAWLAVARAVAEDLERTLPAGVLVEPKDLAVAVHWRRAPEAEAEARLAVADAASSSGLRIHDGRLSLELRPPVDVDKGTATEQLVAECGARNVWYLGDDLGDLPAFAALRRMRDAGLGTLTVAARDEESAPEVADAADVVVDGPRGVVHLLSALADALR